MVILNEGTDKEVTLRVVLESEVYGREYFDDYESLDEIMQAVRRLTDNASQGAAQDGIERIVAVAIVPRDHYGDEEGYGYGLGDDDDESDADTQ